jgi:hypothetical protein
LNLFRALDILGYAAFAAEPGRANRAG